MIVNVIKNHVVKSIQKVRVGFEISAFAGMELSGKSRPYVGTRIGTLSSGLSLMLEAYYPLSSFEEIEGINIEEIEFLEIDPYLYLGLPILSTLIYVGVAPIVIFDVTNTSFILYSTEIFHAKAGFRFGGGEKPSPLLYSSLLPLVIITTLTQAFHRLFSCYFFPFSVFSSPSLKFPIRTLIIFDHSIPRRASHLLYLMVFSFNYRYRYQVF